MKHLSRFSVLLFMVVLMVVGVALLPTLDVADTPREVQGQTLTIRYAWPGASAKVVEQNVTSVIEGLVASVKGVGEVTSESNFGGGHVDVRLKAGADVSATKFEVASLLRQVYGRLPSGVSYPDLAGGEVPRDTPDGGGPLLLLTYQVNSALSPHALRQYAEGRVLPALRRMEGVEKVEVTGTTEKYIDVRYDAQQLALYGMDAARLEEAIRSFVGRSQVVGEVSAATADGHERRMALYLTTEGQRHELEQLPVGEVAGKTVYLNDLATFEYKDRQPDSYYRVNGLNTVYLNIYTDPHGNKIQQSARLRKGIELMLPGLRRGVWLTLTHDAAQEKASHLRQLVWRSVMALLILLAFVWLTVRSLRYVGIMAVMLAANILLAATAYRLFDIRLHVYSLAGITVSLGMIVDATVVMADHYSYYHNRRAFFSILAALLTTIGSLVVVLWLPGFLQHQLLDFSLIIIINLTVALLTAFFFVPALIDQCRYSSGGPGRVRHGRAMVAFTHRYARYVRWASRWRWALLALVVLTFGLPFHALPERLGDEAPLTDGAGARTAWWQRAYNATLGTDFFQEHMKEPLAKVLGGSMRLFAQSLDQRTYAPDDDRRKVLHIRAQMPVGGSVAALNEKIVLLENFLARQPRIRRFETRVEQWGATVDVFFHDADQNTGLPYLVENKVIGKVIAIGGADWSTSGVSERGFSNALNLQARGRRIEIAGYNYDRLYRVAELIVDSLRLNRRVQDIVIETPGHEQQENEYFMRYHTDAMALYGIRPAGVHTQLRNVVGQRQIAQYRDQYMTADITLTPQQRQTFDLWHVQNATLRVADRDVCLARLMDVERREAKNNIPKHNQEYVLRVAFNVLGSYNYATKYIDRLTHRLNATMPVGFRCVDTSPGYYDDNGVQYWLLLLIVVIIYAMCAVLFESLRLPLAILSLVPVSFTGAFVAYTLTGVDFGAGGFASLVLLCGLTVNAAIYILSEYRYQMSAHVGMTPLRAYVRAYNHKVKAVSLTILSTVLGLVPFFLDGSDEPFWFSFATGATGGLLFSVIALVLVMPACLRLGTAEK